MTLKLNFNNFSFIVGVLGLITLLPPLLAILIYILPSCRQKDLDEVLRDTESLWRIILEEGLFQGSPFVQITEHKLAQFRLRATNLRMDTYRATNVFQDMRGIVSGLSLNITILCGQVKSLRATISTTTAEERKRLQNEGLYMHMSPSANVYQSETRSVPHAPVTGTYHSTNVTLIPKLFIAERVLPSFTSYAPEPPIDIQPTLPLHESISIESSSDLTTLASSNVGEVDLGHRSSADVDVEEEQAQTPRKDFCVMHQQIYIQPNPADVATPPHHSGATASTLHKILRRIQHDMGSAGYSHPLLPAATEFARNPHCVDLESLSRQYEDDASALNSTDLEMQGIRG
ncbi:hypothetical protein BKA93DRAFT_508246 [Sparassis latifolia]